MTNNDRILAARIAAGDHEAFEQLVMHRKLKYVYLSLHVARVGKSLKKLFKTPFSVYNMPTALMIVANLTGWLRRRSKLPT